MKYILAILLITTNIILTWCTHNNPWEEQKNDTLSPQIEKNTHIVSPQENTRTTVK